MKCNPRIAVVVGLVLAFLASTASTETCAQEKQAVDPKEEQRQTIFLAAKALFLNRGYGAVSMADIADAAKVDQNTLRSHYATKEVLEHEMLTWWHKVELDNFKKWIADGRKASDDPLEQTIAFLKNFEDFAVWYAKEAKQPPPGEIWAAFIYDHHNHSKEVRARIARDMRSWEEMLEEQFATIYSTRKPRIDVTAKDLAHSLMATIEGTVILGRTWDDRHMMSRRVRQFREKLPLLFEAEVESPNPNATAAFPSGTVQRIAFGSCAKHWQHQSIWETVIGKEPDLFLFLGDAIYADTDGRTAWLVTEQQLQGEWNRLADKPEFQKARAAVPMMAIWDNHDYGSHAGGVEFPVKEASKKIFLDFFGEPEDSERRRTPGIYDAKVFGPQGRSVQIILLDTRFFKDPYTKDPREREERLAAGKVGGYVPNDDPSATLLGEEQWAWLEKQLREPAEVRLIASSVQIVPDEKGMDEWGNFPRERKRLFDLIKTTGAEGVILLSGNVHFAEISRYKGAPYPLMDFTSSGMTHIDEVYAKAKNSYRVAGPYVDLNVGLVEIDWAAKPSAQITLKAIADDGSTAFTHRVSLDALQ